MSIESQAVRDLLVQARCDAARMDAEEAIGWVVVSRDDESGALHISGVIAEPEQALIEAARQHESVHKGHQEGEPGWTVAVYPLFPVSG